MQHLVEILLPLSAGFVYTIGAMVLKRALEEGIGLTFSFVLTNLIAGIGALPLLLISHQVHDWTLLHWPLLTSCTFFGGTLFFLTSLKTGAVSIQTPLMGSKVPIVAFISVVFFARDVPFAWWLGAFLTFGGMLVLGLPDILKKSLRVSTVVYALFAALMFGLSDILIETHAKKFGEVPFVVLMLFVTGILSLVLLPLTKKKTMNTPPKAWSWVFWGGFLMMLQELLLAAGLAYFGNATLMNILYSGRVLWSIALVWFIGHWFKNLERQAGIKTMIRRSVAGALIFVAIVIVIVNS